MRNGTKLLLAVIVIPAAIYGGIKFTIHRNVKSGLEELTRVAAPYVSIRYGKIDSSLDGSVVIHDVRLQPTGLTDTVPIDEIEIKMSGLGALLTARRQIDAGDHPEIERVTMRGLSLDLRSAMMSSLDTLIGTLVDSGNIPRGRHCGDIHYFGPRTYRRLGYDTLVMDIAVGEVREAFINRLTLQVDWRARDLAELETRIVLGGIPGNLKAPSATLDPQVVSVKAVYRDRSYVERVKTLCAEASGVSTDEYVRLVSEDDETFAATWGVTPGPGLRNAWRRFLEKPGMVQIESRPADGLDPRNLALYKPQDLVAMLNLSLTVNDEAVTDLSVGEAIRMPAREAPAATPQAPATVQPVIATPASLAPATVSSAQPAYHPVALDVLPQHIGRKLKLHVPGRVHEGILVGLDQKSVTIARQYRGSGTMTYKVPRARIGEAEVLY